MFLLRCNNQYKLHDAALPKIEMPAEHTAWRCFQKEQGEKSSSASHLQEFWRLFFIPDAPGAAAAAASSMRSPSSNSILLLYSTSFSPDLKRRLGWKWQNYILHTKYSYQILAAPIEHYGTHHWEKHKAPWIVPSALQTTQMSALIKQLTNNQESKSITQIQAVKSHSVNLSTCACYLLQHILMF